MVERERIKHWLERFYDGRERVRIAGERFGWVHERFPIECERFEPIHERFPIEGERFGRFMSAYDMGTRYLHTIFENILKILFRTYLDARQFKLTAHGWW